MSDTNENESENSADDLRAAVAAAFEATEVEAEETEATPEPEAKVEEAPAETVEDTPAPEKEEAVTTNKADDTEAEEKPAEEKAEKRKEYKAPQRWSVEQRQKFGSLDPDLQEQIHAGEAEVQAALKGTKNERDFAVAMYKEFQPFEADMQAYQTTPVRMLKDMMQVQASLWRGGPEEKAKVTAWLINRYQVDLSALETQLISGGKGAPTAAPKPTMELPEDVKAKLNDLEELKREANERKSAAQHQAKTAVHDEFQKSGVEKLEFFNDVRADMHRLLSDPECKMSSFKEAYDAAVWARADIRKVLLDREKAPKDASTQAKLRAASSVKSEGPKALAHNKPAKQYDNVNDATKAAFAKLGLI